MKNRLRLTITDIAAINSKSNKDRQWKGEWVLVFTIL
jgi:hypothetical protein